MRTSGADVQRSPARNPRAPLGSRRKLAVATLQQQQQQEEEEAERRHSLGASADERWGGMACGNTQKKKIL
ncbi:unnamed protein product [Lampetra fluviatilis]